MTDENNALKEKEQVKNEKSRTLIRTNGNVGKSR